MVNMAGIRSAILQRAFRCISMTVWTRFKRLAHMEEIVYREQSFENGEKASLCHGSHAGQDNKEKRTLQ